MKKIALLVVCVFGFDSLASARGQKIEHENNQASVAMMDDQGHIEFLSVNDVSEKIIQLRETIKKERLLLFMRMQKIQHDMHVDSPYRMNIKKEIAASGSIPDQYSRSAYLYSALCNFRDMVKHGFTGTYLIMCIGGEVLVNDIMPVVIASAGQAYEYVKYNFEQMYDSAFADIEKEGYDDKAGEVK